MLFWQDDLASGCGSPSQTHFCVIGQKRLRRATVAFSAICLGDSPSNPTRQSEPAKNHYGAALSGIIAANGDLCVITVTLNDQLVSIPDIPECVITNVLI
jgi:hypothetical protein